MKSKHYSIAPRRPVDHERLAELFSRHASGDANEVAERYSRHYQLSSIDLLRIRNLLRKRQKTAAEAAKRDR